MLLFNRKSDQIWPKMDQMGQLDQKTAKTRFDDFQNNKNILTK